MAWISGNGFKTFYYLKMVSCALTGKYFVNQKTMHRYKHEQKTTYLQVETYQAATYLSSNIILEVCQWNTN